MMRIKQWSNRFTDRWLNAKEWWLALTPREKQTVSIGGSALAIFIIYAGIWSPYLNHVSTMRARIKSQQKLLLWMQAADQEINKIEKQSPGTSGKTIAPVVLLSLIKKQVDHAGLTENLTQLKQSSNAAIEMHFQKVGFDKLSSLLIAAAKQYNVAVVQMSVTAESTPGIVNADIVLKNG
jgi:type II secretory pathway component PulM